MNSPCNNYWMDQLFAPQSGIKLVPGHENPKKLWIADLNVCERLCMENLYCEGFNVVKIDEDTMGCWFLTDFKNLERYLPNRTIN